MIFPTRSELLHSLERLRLNICAYGGANDGRCDCKYGTSTPAYGEENGCPELKAAHAIISRMSGKQYRELVLQQAAKAGRDSECLPQFRRPTSVVRSNERGVVQRVVSRIFSRSSPSRSS